MEYTDITLTDNVYEVQEEARKAGLEDLIAIIPIDIVQSFPTFGTTASGTISANEAIVTASGVFAWKTGKKPTKLFCIIEKNSLESKLLNRSTYETDVKVTIQNTVENQGFIENLRKIRFIAYLKKVEGDGMLLGKTGVTTGYLAHLKADSLSEKSGEKFNDDAMIEFVITAKPYRPYAYNETFSFAAGV